jgi:hypothetical protein
MLRSNVLLTLKEANFSRLQLLPNFLLEKRKRNDWRQAHSMTNNGYPAITDRGRLHSPCCRIRPGYMSNC